MYIFLIVIHVIVCLFLVFVILLQAGRGGGFSDMMAGGGQPQSIFGTQTNVFMTRLTEICAIVFVVTSLSLAVMSTQRGKSLVEKEMMMRSLKQSLPAMPAVPTTPAPVPTVSTPEVEPVKKLEEVPSPQAPAPAAPSSPQAQAPTEGNAK